MDRIEAIKEQLATLKQLVVTWRAFDLTKAMDALGASLTVTELLLAEVADLRESLDAVRVELDAHAKAIAGLEGKS